MTPKQRTIGVSFSRLVCLQEKKRGPLDLDGVYSIDLCKNSLRPCWLAIAEASGTGRGRWQAVQGFIHVHTPGLLVSNPLQGSLKEIHFAHLKYGFFHQSKGTPPFTRQCSGVECKDPCLKGV